VSYKFSSQLWQSTFPYKVTGKIIKENLILFSNYFAINYFANFLSQNFWNKTLGRETAYNAEIFCV